MGSARREGEQWCDPRLSAGERSRAPHASSRASARSARAAPNSTRVRAPAERWLYYEGYVKHLSVYHSFFSPPPSFFTFHHAMISPCLALGCWSPLCCVSLLFACFKLCLFSRALPELNPGCNMFILATGVWWVLMSVRRYLHWMCMDGCNWRLA